MFRSRRRGLDCLVQTEQTKIYVANEVQKFGNLKDSESDKSKGLL